jgi:hypothetical protein
VSSLLPRGLSQRSFVRELTAGRWYRPIHAAPTKSGAEPPVD